VSFERCHSTAVPINSVRRLNAKIGMAQIALREGDAVGAMRAIQEPFSHLDKGGSLDCNVQPGLIRLVCYRALAANKDVGAVAALNSARSSISEVASSLPDLKLRQSFLNIPEHREIMECWTEMNRVGGLPSL
jgi:hypothetical protein